MSFATTPGLIDDVSSALGRTRSASTDDVEVAMGRMARTAGARVIVVLARVPASHGGGGEFDAVIIVHS